ncbi:MAG: glycosyl hydrolase, partial [Candidatus Aminicenantes bacterium]|nr:glycosyl hydrolase [Candidatus Aminicenantes bacterium]
VSTSQFGTIVSLDESTLDANLLMIGTDDGVIQITTDGGKNWNMYSSFPGVPKYTYVSDLMASRYDKNTIYATFDNRKRDDFKPYVLVSNDLGKTWRSISSNLPKGGTVHTIAQDHQKKDLIFAGTEFGAFFTIDSGKNWTQLKSGIPTISVRDIMIQRDMNDLALATFGRGFYILDDYSPLRELNSELIKKEADIFAIRDSLQYIQTRPKYGQGATEYLAKNPEYGATFTYFLKDSYKSKKSLRKKKEGKLFKKGEKIYIPTWNEIREEGFELTPYLTFTITDKAGNIVKKLYKKGGKGINRINWDLSMSFNDPIELKKKFNPLAKQDDGFPAMPGKYNLTLSKVIEGVETKIAGPVEFTTKILNNATLPAKDRSALDKFLKKVTEMSRVIQGNISATNEMKEKIGLIRQTLHSVPSASGKIVKDAAKIEREIDDIIFKFRGHRPKASREEIPPAHPTITSRLYSVLYAQFATTAAPSGAQFKAMEILTEEMKPIINDLKKIALKIKGLEKQLEKMNAPWTSGRILDFK